MSQLRARCVLLQSCSTWGQRHSTLQKAYGVYVRLLDLRQSSKRGRGRGSQSSGRGKEPQLDIRQANGLYASKYLEIAAHFNRKGIRYLPLV